jgi:hypothetical protein
LWVAVVAPLTADGSVDLGLFIPHVDSLFRSSCLGMDHGQTVLVAQGEQRRTCWAVKERCEQ